MTAPSHNALAQGRAFAARLDAAIEVACLRVVETVIRHVVAELELNEADSEAFAELARWEVSGAQARAAIARIQLKGAPTNEA